MTAAHRPDPKQPWTHSLKLAETAGDAGEPAAAPVADARLFRLQRLAKAILTALTPARRGFYDPREAERFHAQRLTRKAQALPSPRV
jgi:hypothetical protein